MKTSLTFLKLTILFAGLLTVLPGCESTDSGHTNTSVYMGVGVYDPWYYGDYCDDPDIVVTPPDRPIDQPRPAHPIATPPPSRPSMPSMPRPSPRR